MSLHLKCAPSHFTLVHSPVARLPQPQALSLETDRSAAPNYAEVGIPVEYGCGACDLRSVIAVEVVVGGGVGGESGWRHELARGAAGSGGAERPRTAPDSIHLLMLMTKSIGRAIGVGFGGGWRQARPYGIGPLYRGGAAC